tara:strand:- start:2330 stop:3184 length:855 start_codon:yes stop_codon:yes gene_type:complete
MGYNVLSGSTSAIGVISSGSFIGDGSGLENVKQFELYNAGDTRIPFYKVVNAEYTLDADSVFTYNTSTDTVNIPHLNASKGITGSAGMIMSGNIVLTGSFLPGQSNVYDLGSPSKQWKSLYVSSSTIYFGGEALSVKDGSMKFGSGSATKGFHVGHMHLLDRGIVMDPNRVFQMKAFQMQFHGGLAYKRNVVSWDYQVLKTDYMIGIQSNTLTASVRLTLPDASICVPGQTFIFKDEGGNCHTHNIVISTSNGDQIDGNTVITLESPYSSVNIYTNGINKYFIY